MMPPPRLWMRCKLLLFLESNCHDEWSWGASWSKRQSTFLQLHTWRIKTLCPSQSVLYNPSLSDAMIISLKSHPWWQVSFCVCNTLSALCIDSNFQPDSVCIFKIVLSLSAVSDCDLVLFNNCIIDGLSLQNSPMDVQAGQHRYTPGFTRLKITLRPK